MIIAKEEKASFYNQVALRCLKHLIALSAIFIIIDFFLKGNLGKEVIFVFVIGYLLFSIRIIYWNKFFIYQIEINNQDFVVKFNKWNKDKQYIIPISELKVYLLKVALE